MLLSLVYFVMRCLLQAMAPSARGDFEREVELLVLRHQLKVLSRGARRPPRAASGLACETAAGEPDPSPLSMEGVRRDASDATPMAPGAGSPQVDISASSARPARTRSRNGGAHNSPGEREPPVGLPPDPRRVAEAWCSGVSHGDPDSSSSTWPRSRPSPERPLVERVPPVPSAGNPGARLLHCGDGVVPHPVRALRNRARIQTGARPRSH